MKPRIVFPDSSVRPVQLVRCQRLSRLCVLMNPCPAGRAIHSDLAGKKSSKNPALVDRTLSGGTQEVKLQIRSVDEPAHADIHHHAQRQERKQHRRSAVTH
jgi:hypothetical protein